MRKILKFRPELCRQDVGCRICAKSCHMNALGFLGGKLQYCRNCSPDFSGCSAACESFAFYENCGHLEISGKCDGCGKCAQACRYGGIKIIEKKAKKCDFCHGLYPEPVCASVCPFGALLVEAADEKESKDEKEQDYYEQLPEIVYLGDENKFRPDEWAQICSSHEPKQARLFFRVLQLPPTNRVLLKKYGNVSIYRIDGMPEPVYYYDFPSLTYEDFRLADELKARVVDELKFEISRISGRKGRIELAEKKASEILEKISPGCGREKKEALAKLAAADIGGFGFLEFLMEDRENIENIEHLRAGEPVHVILKDKQIGHCKTNFLIADESAFRHTINRLAEPLGKSISEANPKLDFFIDKADRVVALCQPYATFGGSFSIRISQAYNPWTLPKLIDAGMMSAEMGAYLWMLEDTKIAGVITGPPGSGKTTLLNAMLQCIPPGLVVRTIEEGTRELDVPDHPWSSFVGRTGEEKELSEKRRHEANIMTGEELLSASLRFYTDRLYIGEIRGPEARYFTTALNLGIPAVKTTMHTHETGASVLSRLCAPPMNVPVENLPYIRIFVHAKKCGDGARRITSIGEIRWNVWNDLPELKDLKPEQKKGNIWQSENYTAYTSRAFHWDNLAKQFRRSRKESIVLREYALEKGMAYQQAERELEAREKILSELARAGKFGAKETKGIFDSHYKNAKTL